MSLLVISSERFTDHLTPPGHPERVERAEVMEVVAARWKASGGTVTEPRAASRTELLAVHAEEHLERIAATAGRAVSLDPDTFTSPGSHAVALLAAGAGLVGVDHALGTGGCALALVRPPGHHAERDRAMGFCLYNSAAVAAAYALARGTARVAVIDYDVHHGNGTQWIFYEDPRVLYVSTHQYPYYPGTGAAAEVGRGEGAGFTLNVPLEVGATDHDYDLVFRTLVVPVLERFQPELIILSAGYDAHERDPLAGMRVTTAGYTRLAAHVRRTADRACKGRLVALTEGGYDLKALAACLESTIEVFSAPTAPLIDPPAPATYRAHAAIDAVRAVQKPFWPGL